MPRPVPDRRRRRAAHRSPVPFGWAPPWTEAELERFVGHVEAVLDARFGPSTTDRQRGVVTFTTSAGQTQLWLGRLADRCAALPARQWRLAVYDHVAALDEVTGVYDDLLAGDVALLRHRLAVRLHRCDTALATAADAVTRPAFGALCAVLVVDLGGSAAWVPGSASASWSVPAAGLFDEAIDRTVGRVRCDLELMERDGLVVVCASGPSFFTATLALRPALLAPVDDELGAILSVPSAHRVLVHPLAPGSRPALELLDALAVPERSRPYADALAPGLFWWRPAHGYRELGRASPPGSGAVLPRDLEDMIDPPP